MSVWTKIEALLEHQNTFPILLGITLSSLLIGYAPSSILFGIFVCLSLLQIIRKKYPPKFEAGLLLPLVFYLFGCMSYFWSVDQAQTAKGMGRLLILFLMPLTAVFLPNFTTRQVKLTFKWFTGFNIGFGIYFLVLASINYLKYFSAEVFTYHNLVDSLELNAIYVSAFFTLSYFFLLIQEEKKKIDKFSLAFLGTMIILLSSKMVILVFIIGNVLFFLKRINIRSLNPLKALYGVVLCCLFIVASKNIFNRIIIETTTDIEEVLNREEFTRIYPWTGTSIRLLQLRNLKEQIEENNIFWKGFGLFASRNDLKERHIKLNTYHGYHDYNYHNMYAQSLSELGIFGLLVLLFMIVLGLQKALKQKNFLMLTFYLMIAFVFLSESFLWVHRGVFFFTIVNTIFHKLEREVSFREKQFVQQKP
jgi:O-antigen ligase